MNYKFIGNFDIKSLKLKVFNIDESIWEEDETRQQVFSYAHKNTKTIPIIWDIESLDSISVADKTKYFDYLNFEEYIYKIKNLIRMSLGEGKIARVVLARLKSNSEIPPHCDFGKGLEVCNRIHIPIITNEDVLFFVGGERKNMKEGEMWEINNQALHQVKNNSNYDRVHLIVDYLRDNVL